MEVKNITFYKKVRRMKGRRKINGVLFAFKVVMGVPVIFFSLLNINSSRLWWNITLFYSVCMCCGDFILWTLKLVSTSTLLLASKICFHWVWYFLILIQFWLEVWTEDSKIRIYVVQALPLMLTWKWLRFDQLLCFTWIFMNLLYK